MAKPTSQTRPPVVSKSNGCQVKSQYINDDNISLYVFFIETFILLHNSYLKRNLCVGSKWENLRLEMFHLTLSKIYYKNNIFMRIAMYLPFHGMNLHSS